jgi:hypothetical protein
MVADLIVRIEETNKTSECKVCFEGKKSGEEYVAFMQSCHIGLNPQKAGSDYMDNAFPSKVLNYLGLGLDVVTSRLKCIELSPIDGIVSYIEDESGESIARAILTADIGNRERNIAKIRELDLDFVERLHHL